MRCVRKEVALRGEGVEGLQGKGLPVHLKPTRKTPKRFMEALG
jgi:hypothetical protein